MSKNVQFNQNYPAFLDLQGRSVLVTGGGINAERKVLRLIGTGAIVQVFAPNANNALKDVCSTNGMKLHNRTVEDNDLSKATLVFIADDERQDNSQLSARAHAAGCFVNVAREPQSSSFLVPSLIDRSPLMVAVSSTGSSPILARILTARIDAFLPHTYRQLAQLADTYRLLIKQRIPDWRLRRRFWERVLSGRIGELILQGRHSAAAQAIELSLDEHQQNAEEGEVYLVGAGPGDPDLLSFRALRLMQQCDVVLFDRLVSENVMALVNQEAERIYVGKQRSNHALPQEAINQRLADLAKQGKRVLRLKGGDPFMFGRGGEEIETLSAQGIAFQIVPGITAATGCASYAGIPLTHRDHAQSCLFVAGHLKDGSVNLDWPALTRDHQTVVIYMGLVGLPVICQQLIKHGLPASHPIALVAQGTTSDQQVVTGTLDSLPQQIENSSIKPPTLIIIGEVVKMREKLAWF